MDRKKLSEKFSNPATERLLFAFGLTVLVSGLCALYLQPPDLHTSDLYSFWAAAQLPGKDLYDPAKLQAIQQASSPLVAGKRFIRPPFYALALWPLGQLPFRAAYFVWYAVNLLALAAFVRIWKNLPLSYFLCALFLPLAWSFGQGQDVPIMLAVFSMGACLVQRNRPFTGGTILSLCAIKPHLFVFLPVVLIAQKRFRALAGMLAGGAALYGISASVLRLDWPIALFSAAQANESAFGPRSLSVSGFLASLGAPSYLSWLIVAAAAGLLFYGAPRWSWLPAAAFAVAAGVICAPHALIYDAALLLPLLLLSDVPPKVIVFAGLLCVAAATRFVWIAQISCFLLLWRARPRNAC
jgi:hypothetical protein